MTVTASQRTRQTCVIIFLRWNTSTYSDIGIDIRHSFYIIGVFEVKLQILFNES